MCNMHNGEPSRPSFQMAICPWIFLTPHPTILVIEDFLKVRLGVFGRVEE